MSCKVIFVFQDAVHAMSDQTVEHLEVIIGTGSISYLNIQAKTFEVGNPGCGRRLIANIKRKLPRPD